MILIGARNGLTAQQVPAVCVAERQRLAAAAVTMLLQDTANPPARSLRQQLERF